MDDPVERERGALWDGPGSHLPTVLRELPGPGAPGLQEFRGRPFKGHERRPAPARIPLRRPALLPDRRPHRPPDLRDVRPGVRRQALADPADAGRRARSPSGPARGSGSCRRSIPAARCISALSLCLLLRVDTLWVVAGGRLRGDREQVRGPGRQEAHLQPDQRRHRPDAADHAGGVAVAGAVGQRRLLRLPDGVPRRPRRLSRAALATSRWRSSSSTRR